MSRHLPVAWALVWANSDHRLLADNPGMVLEPLRQASDELQLLAYHELASKAFHLMAIVYDKLGLFDDREEAASSFKKHILACENPQENDCLLSSMLQT